MATRRQFLKVGAGAAGLLAAAAPSPGSGRETRSKTGKPRLIYNDDGNSVVFIPHRYPMKVEELTDLVDQFSGTPVDRYVYCLVLPRVFLHDTKVGERAWDLAKGTYASAFDFRRGENARHLVEQGNDPVRVLGERAHQRGLQYFVSQRMNDAHFAYSKEGPEKNFWTGTFWHQHPELRIGGNSDSTSSTIDPTPSARRTAESCGRSATPRASGCETSTTSCCPTEGTTWPTSPGRFPGRWTPGPAATPFP